MDGTSIYLTLPSNSSADFFPNNHFSKFSTQLAQPLILDQSLKHTIALAELVLPEAPQKPLDCYIYCSITRLNVVGDSYAKLLRMIRLTTDKNIYEFRNLYFHEVDRVNQVAGIDLLLTDQFGEELTAPSYSARDLATVAVLCIHSVPTPVRY